jgi:hypothetical protein
MDVEGDKIYIPRGGTAVKAIYSEQLLEEYKNNPLIEALPPILNKEAVIEVLSCLPYQSDDERKLDAEYRYHCVQRLFQYFEPLNKHIDIEQRFSRTIRQGYLARNPLGPDYAARLQYGYRQIKTGGYNLSNENTFRSTAAGFTIVGMSGMGKTTTIEKILCGYPQIIVHSRYKEQNLSLYQVPWLKLDCPFDGSIKGLCINFFNAVDRLLGTDYYKKFASGRNSVDAMLPRMEQVASLHCIGVLIIDEIQHLSLAKSGGSEKMLNFFVTLVNTIGIPVILVGTSKALPVLQGEFRQARRGSGQGDMVWDRMRNDSSWKLLLSGMWGLQWTKKVSPLSQEIIDVLYEESQGIIDIAIKLYAMAQIRAIVTGKEFVTEAIILQVAKDSLTLVRPMLEALKSGNLDIIDKYKDITPLDLEVFRNEQLQLLRDKLDKENLKETTIKKPLSTKETIIDSTIHKLVELGVKFELASESVKNAIDIVGVEDGSLLLKEAFRLGVIGIEIKKTDKKKAIKAKPNENNLLKSIVDEGKLNKKSAYEALRDKGFIKDPMLELIEKDDNNVELFPQSIS